MGPDGLKMGPLILTFSLTSVISASKPGSGLCFHPSLYSSCFMHQILFTKSSLPSWIGLQPLSLSSDSLTQPIFHLHLSRHSAVRSFSPPILLFLFLLLHRGFPFPDGSYAAGATFTTLGHEPSRSHCTMQEPPTCHPAGHSKQLSEISDCL